MNKDEMREKFIAEHPDFNGISDTRVKEGFCKFCGMRLAGYHKEFPCVESEIKL